MPADEIQDQAALLALGEAQAAADLLLEEHRALRRTQEQQRIDERQVDALVVQVAGHQRGDLAPCEQLGRAPALVRGRVAQHAQRLDAGLVQPRRHVLRVRHRDAEQQRPPARGVARQPPPLVEHQPRARVVAGDQLVDRSDLPCLLPRHSRKVGLVVAGVILEGAQQLLVERMPEPKLDRRPAGRAACSRRPPPPFCRCRSRRRPGCASDRDRARAAVGRASPADRPWARGRNRSGARSARPRTRA